MNKAHIASRNSNLLENSWELVWSAWIECLWKKVGREGFKSLIKYNAPIYYSIKNQFKKCLTHSTIFTKFCYISINLLPVSHTSGYEQLHNTFVVQFTYSITDIRNS